MDQKLMEIRVTCHEPLCVEGKKQKIVMIPFGGEACGDDFTGKVTGPGVDTQKITDGKTVLSARYMLEGKDREGNDCRVFVENQGDWDTGFTPTIVTDSPVLQEWEDADLYATAEGIPEGVMIRIFRK